MASSGTTFKLDLNEKEITNALVEAFGEANDKFEEEAQREITSPKWDWPNETLRKNKEIAGTKRDIVDRGQIRDSYTRSKNRSSTEFTHSWTADHAMANHEGAKFRDGRETPARPWTEKPVEQFEGNFDAIAKVKLERVK